jgi:class 3 adenylate cyclase/tetratricopeptide (TPR) repeat protein
MNLNQAILSEGSMEESEKNSTALLRSISAYVPELVVREALGTAPPIGEAVKAEAALLFADISGFTAMSETLAQMGKEGAEELTRVLNAYFTSMIDLVRSYGGQIIKFGGDAITCAFIDPDPLPTEILRACACALAMQEQMGAFEAVETRGGTFELRMKIGISAGHVLSLTVGIPEEGLEYVLAGRPLDRMSQAERSAVAGEVVIDGTCVGDAGTDWTTLGIATAEDRQGHLLIAGLERDAPQFETETLDWQDLSTEDVERGIRHIVPYLPPTIYEQILEGQRQFIGEHRRVASMFVNFAGLDYDNDPGVAAKLQRYFTTMQGIVHRYGGRLNRVTTGDKGNILHIIFGAPVAHENNEERAIGCALEMQQQVEGLPFITDQRIGIASGYVFAGRVGSERRREYTTMGDVVNLSARLMQAAPERDILTSQDTARAATQEFVCQDLPSIRVKGKRDPIPVCRAVGVREEAKIWGTDQVRTRRYGTPIVGRERELGQIRQIINRAAAGQGQLLVISGEAGVGKSRLLDELIVLAQENDVFGLGGDCLSYGSQSPYLPWIDFFNAFFDLGEKDAVEEKIQRLEQKMVAADATFKDWTPLMGQLLGLPLPDNHLTASLDAQLRKQRTFDITLRLLRHQAQQVPLLLIVFEDVHWIDAISLEMLNYVAHRISGYPILLIAIHRPTIELTEWQTSPYYYEVNLTDLPAEDALNLIEIKLGMSQLTPRLREIALRGEMHVNPFFVEEVINSLIDHGYLVPRETGEGYDLVGDLSRANIPDSIHTLVMSRIDRLDESSKLTVKVASVIGRTFKYRTLSGAYPVQITADRLRANLERLSTLDLTPLDRPAPDWEYIFKHVTTQEVAYESLLYSDRRELHRRVAIYLEQSHADSLPEYYELLAHHYSHSSLKEKGWEYLILAGDKAREKYANEAAIAHYKRALSIEIDRADAYRAHTALGDVYRLIGQYDKARESYQAALDAASPESLVIADIKRKIATVWSLQGRYDEAKVYLDEAQAYLDEAQASLDATQQRLLVMAKIYNDRVWLALQRADLDEALRFSRQALSIANELPPGETTQRIKAAAQHSQGSAYLRMGDFASASVSYQECIDTERTIGNLEGMSRTYNNLAAVYWSQGDFDSAADYIRKSLEIHLRVGKTYGTAMCYNNLGVIAFAQGDRDAAIEHYEKSLAIRKEIGDLLGIADVHTNLGEVYHALGKNAQAREQLEEAERIFSEIGNKAALADVHKLRTEVELESDNVESAREHGQALLEIAREVENREYEGVAHRMMGQIHRHAEAAEESRQHLQQSIEILSQLGNKLELAHSHYELGLTLSTGEREAARSHLQSAARIFEELGIDTERAKALDAIADLP